jgi:flavin reductase (DIM6/NTAB) family NADH-FMN oxidoreductase RutF
MDIRHIPDTLVIQPSILYFGTPVLLITTRNPDGSTNITPMSQSLLHASTWPAPGAVCAQAKEERRSGRPSTTER